MKAVLLLQLAKVSIADFHISNLFKILVVEGLTGGRIQSWQFEDLHQYAYSALDNIEVTVVQIWK